MRIGILADIHGQLGPLRNALAMLEKAKVDQVVVLGDTLDGLGELSDATTIVTLLEQANVLGVWGNHDFGLCHMVMDEARDIYAPEVFDFMVTMRPRLEIEDCYFSHCEPWVDPYDLMELWSFDGYPDTVEKVLRSFRAVTHRHMFIGHFHRWIVMTPTDHVDWQGESVLRLNGNSRYLVVVPAVYDGYCAIFDTETNDLTPKLSAGK